MVEPTVLIVEDSPPMTEILKKIFQDNVGCTILEATDGIEAVKKYKQYRPDLVTMRIDMQKASGIVALDAIMEIDPNAKVIIISARSQKDLPEDVLRIGALGYITKPFDKNIITPILVKALRDALVDKKS
jgi:two-component system chemotaxis response regulator CheY